MFTKHYVTSTLHAYTVTFIKVLLETVIKLITKYNISGTKAKNDLKINSFPALDSIYIGTNFLVVSRDIPKTRPHKYFLDA